MGRAVELACLVKSELTVLTVIKPGSAVTTIEGLEPSQLANFQRELVYKHFPPNGIAVESNDPASPVYRYLGSGGVRIRCRIEKGDPVERICAVAKEFGADLVIVGNRGLGDAGVFVLGSVSEKVVRKCSRSVLVVKGEGSDSSEWESISHSQRVGVKQHLR